MDATRTAGLTGIVGALLFGTGSAIWGLDMPNAGAPVDEVVAFYRDTADRIVVGASLSLLAIAAALVFAAALRAVLVDAGAPEFLATASFGGALLGMGAGLGAETINMAAALRARGDELTPELARSLFEVSQILGSTAAAVGFGVFAIAVAAAALRSRAVLPRWVAWVTLVAGVALLTPLAHLNELAGSALVLVALLIGATLLRRSAADTVRA